MLELEGRGDLDELGQEQHDPVVGEAVGEAVIGVDVVELLVEGAELHREHRARAQPHSSLTREKDAY